MTVSSEDSQVEYTGDGSETDFTVPFKFLADTDLQVETIDTAGAITAKTLNTHFTVTGAGDDEGGTVTITTAPTSGHTVRITRYIPLRQEVDLVSNDPLPAATLEEVFDRLLMQIQQIAQRTGSVTYVQGTDALSLGTTDSTNWDAESLKIRNVTDPTTAQDAATKAYVDAQTAVATGALVSVDGVSNAGGNVDFVGSGGGITITPDDAGNRIVFSVALDAGNATQIQSRDVASTLPTDGQVLGWSDANSQWEPTDLTGADATTIQSVAVDATTPTTGQVLTYDGTEWAPASPAAQQVAVICDQKTSGTYGGTFTSGAWQTRDLNTEIYDPNAIVSIASNQFTLAAGTYRVHWRAPARQVAGHISKLYDVTGAADVALGTSEYGNAAEGVTTASEGWARFTIASSNVYEIRHKCSSTRSSDGFGRAVGLGVEKYTIVQITKE